jgi:diaminohydroxyphosphoribosylaminopyrimidine deaminase/5-amino-6-(5-phosphoribosylamino)uracil reductase
MKNRWIDLDRHLMAEAISLARKGQTTVEPNPAVGAIIARSTAIIGKGYHRRFASAHAEVEAINDALAKGHNLRGATMYVTLEPCCHIGKTPPCVDAIIREGISRVVVAVKDPSDKVKGKGIRTLRKAGIRVEVGLLTQEAQAINAWFFKVHETHRPWVIGKWAQTLDGKLACSTGDSQWISSSASRKLVHKLRRSVQAIVTGIGTVSRDNPELTVRLVRPSPAGPPLRVVLDAELRTRPDSKLVRSAIKLPTIIYTSGRASSVRKRKLEARNCQIRCARSVRGCLDLQQIIDELGQMGVARVLVEAGPRLISSFLAVNLFDEIIVFQSPTFALDHRALQLTGQDLRKISNLLVGFRFDRVQRAGDDVILVLRRR